MEIVIMFFMEIGKNALYGNRENALLGNRENAHYK